MNPWRLQTAEGPRYATVCPGCQLLRGWNREAAVVRYQTDLANEGFVVVATRETYEHGADGTCACAVDSGTAAVA